MSEHLDLTGDVIRLLRGIVDTVPGLTGFGRFVTNLEVRHAAMTQTNAPPPPETPPEHGDEPPAA